MSLMEAFTSLFSHYWTVSPVCNAPPDSQCSCSSKEFKGAECEVKRVRSTAQAAFSVVIVNVLKLEFDNEIKRTHERSEADKLRGTFI